MSSTGSMLRSEFDLIIWISTMESINNGTMVTYDTEFILVTIFTVEQESINVIQRIFNGMEKYNRSNCSNMYNSLVKVVPKHEK